MGQFGCFLMSLGTCFAIHHWCFTVLPRHARPKCFLVQAHNFIEPSSFIMVSADEEDVREPLKSDKEGEGTFKLGSCSVSWQDAFWCSCGCNVLLFMVSSYFVWYAIFRPPVATVCALDYRSNLDLVKENVSAVVDEYNLADATSEEIDCYLALYKHITFSLANYSDEPTAYQWKMQLGSDSDMAEVFAERRAMMSANNFAQLYELLKADGVWAYLYSRYFPEDVREALMLADMHETAMMVTMVKMPECIGDLSHTYRLENYEKYYFYARYAANAASVHEMSQTLCDNFP